jgi:WD40 repeat protein
MTNTRSTPLRMDSRVCYASLLASRHPRCGQHTPVCLHCRVLLLASFALRRDSVFGPSAVLPSEALALMVIGLKHGGGTASWALGRNRVTVIQFSQDGLTLLILSNRFLTTLDSDTGASLKMVPTGQELGRHRDWGCILMSPNGHLVVFENNFSECLFITNILQDPVETTRLFESTPGVTEFVAGQFTADGKLFFWVRNFSSDQCPLGVFNVSNPPSECVLRVFDVSNPPYKCVRIITCPRFHFNTAAFLPNDNTKWVALHYDRRLRLWNVASGEHTVVATLQGNGDSLYCA